MKQKGPLRRFILHPAEPARAARRGGAILVAQTFPEKPTFSPALTRNQDHVPCNRVKQNNPSVDAPAAGFAAQSRPGRPLVSGTARRPLLALRRRGPRVESNPPERDPQPQDRTAAS